MLALCRLRQARAGEKGAQQHGDYAVRLALSEVSAPALVWILSRAVSYMDETGFPRAVEPWFRGRSRARGLTLPAWLRAALHPQRSRRQSRRPSGRNAASAR